MTIEPGPAFVPYTLLAIGHLAACWRGDERWRRVTKPWLMLVLLLTYIIVAPPASLWIVFALVFALAGDTILLGTNPRAFFWGGLAFLIGHVMYALGFLTSLDVARVPWWAPLAGLVYLAAAIAVYRPVAANLGRIKPATIAYLVALNVMSLAAWLVWSSTGGAEAAVALAGSLVFVVSDVMLIWDRYRRPIARGTFWIMATYLVAQGLIVASRCLTG